MWVMNQVHGVAKSMTVGSGNNSYKWVSDKDVKTLLREAMMDNWLSILPIGVNAKIQVDRWEEVDAYSKSTPKDMKSKQSIFTEVDTKYLLLHTSGESIELAGYGQGVDTQDKGAGKATTYALKNTLLNMFLIPTGVDSDNTHSDEYDVPKVKQASQDDRSWFGEKHFQEMLLWLEAGEVVSKSALWTDYKISKLFQEKIKTEVVKYPTQFTQ